MANIYKKYLLDRVQSSATILLKVVSCRSNPCGLVSAERSSAGLTNQTT